MDDIVVIALFRHGLTEENKRKAYLGWNDSPLCPESQGISTNSTYDFYFSSDLYRCISTAHALFPDKNIYLLEEVREMNFGNWEGKTYEELKDEKLYRQWIEDPSQFCPPNGESFERFSKRVENGWSRVIKTVLSKNIQRCAVMTHGGVIRRLLTKFAPEQKEFWSWNVPHGTGIELIFNLERLRRGERCILLQEVPLTGKEHG